MSMALGQLSRAASLYSSIHFNVNTRMCEMSGCSPDTGSGAARSRQVQTARRGGDTRSARAVTPATPPSDYT